MVDLCYFVVFLVYFHRNSCTFQAFPHDCQFCSRDISNRVYDGPPTIVQYDRPDSFLEVQGVLPPSLPVLAFPYFIPAKGLSVWSQAAEALFRGNSNEQLNRSLTIIKSKNNKLQQCLWPIPQTKTQASGLKTNPLSIISSKLEAS